MSERDDYLARRRTLIVAASALGASFDEVVQTGAEGPYLYARLHADVDHDDAAGMLADFGTTAIRARGYLSMCVHQTSVSIWVAVSGPIDAPRYEAAA